MCSGVTGLSCVDKYAEADGAKCAAGSPPACLPVSALISAF